MARHDAGYAWRGMKSSTDQLKLDIVAALKEERWGDALSDLETWCEQFPDHARSWLNRGYCLVRLGRFNEAVSALDRCLELDPESEGAQGWRARALAQLDQPHTVSRDLRPDRTGTVAARPIAPDVTEPEPSESVAPPTYATISVPESGRSWLAGSVVDGRYEVQRVARGGMAVVAIAFDRELRRMVAVKTPLPSVLATADGRARFQREAESWIALGVHPNICCAYYLQQIGGMPRLFIEYVDGGDLSQWLKREADASLDQRLDIAIQIASGLDYTHSFLWTDDDGVEHQGVVHRDIKPANVLMTADGIARITDFGLVRCEGVGDVADEDVRTQIEPELPHTGRLDDSVATGSWQTVTVAGGLVGTPPYMAPELWKQSLRGTIATDVYAFGCMLYELVCGRRPFVMKGSSASQTREAHLGKWMRMHLKDEPPDPASFVPSVTSRLGVVMRSCIAKDAGRRPQSFAVLRGWLVEAFEEVAGQPYPRPEPQRTQLLADSLNNRGASFVTLGLADRADMSFREALGIDPRHLEATFNSGLLEWRRDGLTDAELERRLSEAERATGNAARAGLLRARLRLLLDDPQGAMEALGALPQAERGALSARRELSFALLARARESADPEGLGEARTLLTTVLKESPSDLTAVIGFAETCSLLGEETVAAEAYTAVRSLDRDLPEDLAQAAAAILPGHRVSRTMAHHAPVQNLRALPDDWIVVRTGNSDAVVWKPTGDRPVHRIDLGGTARQGRSMAVADGVLVVCLENGPLTLFDLEIGQRLRSLRIHPGVAICVELSPDGRMVASGGSDRALRLWNLESGECERTLQGHEAFISGLAWHPTEPRILTASADGTLRVWNLDQGRCVDILEGHRGAVRDLALDADRRMIVSAGQDGAVGFWDLATGSNIRFLRGHRGAVTSVALVGDCVAAGGDDGTVRIWRADGGEALRVIRLAHPVQDLVATADGAAMLAAFGSSVVRLELPEPLAARLPLVLADSAASGELAGWELEFRKGLDVAREHIEAGRMEEAIEPLRKAREVPGYELHEEALALWNRVLAFFPKVAPRAVVELRRFGDGRGVVAACALTPDGSSCLAGSGDGSLRLFETDTGEEILTMDGHDQGLLAVAADGDGRWLASAGRDGAVRVWEAGSGELRHDYAGHEGAVHSLAFAPDSSVVVSAGDDRTLRVWPLDDSALPELLGSADDAVSAVAVSADGRFVVSGGWDNRVTVWSLPRRAELRRMEGHEGPVHAVAVSPDCRVVASAGEDGTVQLWDLEGGRRWRVLSGHDGAVHAVAFTPDARFVLSAGKDATLRLWDVRTGTAVRVIEGHAGSVTDVVVSRNGGAAVSAGSDTSLRLWFLDWEPELPEGGRWDDRVRPFLKVFLRRREHTGTAGGMPTWSEDDVRELVEDLETRGFGWLASERVEKELESLARDHDESRTEEQEHTQELARKRQRQQRVAPVKRLVGILTRNLGIKIAGAATVFVLVLLGVASLRTPDSGVAEFNRRLRGDMAMLVRERGMRLGRGTVLAYQNRPTIGASDCGEDSFVALVDLALNVEKMHSPPLDPGVPASEEGMRVRYSNAVNCIGTLGDLELVEPVLLRARTGRLHPFRLEDLLGVLVRIGASGDPHIQAAITDNSETVRHLAALTLLHGSEPSGRKHLFDALSGEEMKGVEAASFVLPELISIGAIDDEFAFETVRRLSANIDPHVRRNAVRALVLFENKGPVRGVLKDALDDNDPEVAATAEKVQATMRSAKLNELFG